ncbi:hypothetical protein [Anaerosporobacter faecicola]|uniref:hypothetical protein n=1 Tax=Anaerosporobacter faecicola TaxID=2718714 RepID=UPI00143B4F94|nr:hypothetical protein [Anaerosporobacter faecicola]
MKSISKKTALVAVAVLVVLVVIICVWLQSRGDGKTGIEKNEGLSYFTQEINDGKITEFNVDLIVPSKETLVDSLEKKDFTVEATDRVFDTDIVGEQVYATKGKEFCAITYALSESEAREVFNIYESKYKENEYYILAMNGNYVYCFSNHKVFKDAGFDTLATNGILYLNHDNY